MSRVTEDGWDETFTTGGLRAAEERGRSGGRPRAISEGDLPAVQKLMRDPEVPPHASPRCSAALAATLYRYVSPEGERRK